MLNAHSYPSLATAGAGRYVAEAASRFCDGGVACSISEFHSQVLEFIAQAVLEPSTFFSWTLDTVLGLVLQRSQGICNVQPVDGNPAWGKTLGSI